EPSPKAGPRRVAVGGDQRPALALDPLPAHAYLVLDRSLALLVRAVTSIDDGAYALSPKSTGICRGSDVPVSPKTVAGPQPCNDSSVWRKPPEMASLTGNGGSQLPGPRHLLDHLGRGDRLLSLHIVIDALGEVRAGGTWGRRPRRWRTTTRWS